MKALKYLDEYISGIALVIIIILISTNVFLRYIMGFILNWAEELATLCFVWCVFSGIASVYKHNRHIGIDVCVNLLPESLQTMISIAVDIIVLIMNLVITYLSIIMMTSSINKPTPVMRIPYAFVNFSLTFGFGLMSLYGVMHLYKKLKR